MQKRLKWCKCIALAACLLTFGWVASSLASIQGPCADCHTMHNSQNAGPMNFDDADSPNDQLLRATCYGCHAQGGSTPTVSTGSDTIPQVFHSSPTHLAGGNFGYISGLAGTGASESKGHNIVDLTGPDSVFTGHTYTPGAIDQHSSGPLFYSSDALRCAGNNGCHGYRAYGPGGDGVYYGKGITGTHHRNVDGQLTLATNPGNSYRFLMAVQGLESPDWEENPSSTNHNEYFALPAPIQLGCDGAGPLAQCHIGPGGLVQPPNGTMSQFCATCHGNFHTLTTPNSDGVGSTASSPFIRHPTDLSLPATGEYAAYTAYSLEAPVARLAVPDAPSGTVNPGSDAVMCLSCHVAHASDYPDMLRWDYSTMIAGGGGSGGCFVCHSTKN